MAVGTQGEPRAGQKSPVPGYGERSGAVAHWGCGFWLTSFPPPAASPGWRTWPAVSVLQPSDACIPPVTLQVVRLSVDVAAEVPPWRRAGSLRSPLPRGSPWPWISWQDPASLAAKMSEKSLFMPVKGRRRARQRRAG